MSDRNSTSSFDTRPGYVHLLLTMACNLRCPHCFVDAGPKMANEMDTLDWLSVADQLVKMRVGTVHVEGGEPLLVPDLIAILNRLASLHDVLLVTNGILVNRNLARQLANVGLKRVALSLDGAVVETNDLFRPGTYDKVVSGVYMLRESGIGVRISTTLMKQNFREALLLIDKCIEWGCELLNFDAFDRIGRGYDHPEFEMTEDDWKQLAEDLLPKAIAVSSNLRISIAIPSKYIKSLGVDVANDPCFQWLTCTSGRSQLAILPDGSVTPCFALAVKPEFVAGNVREQSLEDIWYRSPYLRYYRKLGGLERCPLGYTGHLFFSNMRRA